jgi:hypothetical protein
MSCFDKLKELRLSSNIAPEKAFRCPLDEAGRPHRRIPARAFRSQTPSKTLKFFAALSSMVRRAALPGRPFANRKGQLMIRNLTGSCWMGNIDRQR